MAKTTRVAIYTRISKDQKKGEGVARQEALCRKRVDKQKKWSVVDVYTDNDISASSRARKPRPEYNRLLDDARAGRIDVILAYSNSRLTRRPREFEDLLDLVDAHGVKIATVVSGDDDLSTADGRMVARIKANVDAAEADRTSERVLAAQAQRRAKGIQRTRSTFGWNGDKLVPEQAEPLKQAIQDVLKGVSTSEIARRWNRDGVPSVTGVKWQQPRVREVLVRWRNAGVLTHKGEPVEGVKGQWKKVCGRKTLEQVRALLLDNSRLTRKVGRPPSSLLSTAAYCGKCNREERRMVSSKAKARDGSERWMYRCSGALSTTGDKCYLGIERKILDKAVMDELRFRLAHDAAQEAPGPEEVALMAELRKERKEIEGREREFIQLAGRGRMPVAALQEELERMAARRADIDLELREIEGRYLLGDLVAEVLPPKKLSINRVAEVGKRLEALTLMQRRELVKRYLRVTVLPGRGPKRIVIQPAGSILRSDEMAETSVS